MDDRSQPFLLRPESIGNDPDSFDAAAALLDASLAPDAREARGPAVKRILNGHSAEFIMMTYAPGQMLTQHKAAHPVTIQCLEGQVNLTVDDTIYELVPGRVAHLKPMTVHEVACPDDAPARNVLLLTMLTAAAGS